jgi:hypothetical protein
MWGLKDNDFILFSCITNKQNAGLIVNYFELNSGFTKEMISLNSGSQRVMDTPNAGGSSVWSEAISFEVLSFMCSAALHKTEMEIEYMPGSKITDYSVKVLGRDLGVSVTRAMKFNKKDDVVFTEEDAHKLLSKKLRGVNESTMGVVSSFLLLFFLACPPSLFYPSSLSPSPTISLPSLSPLHSSLFSLIIQKISQAWDKQILHVWTQCDYMAGVLWNTYEKLDESLKSNTLVIVTVCENAEWIFRN